MKSKILALCSFATALTIAYPQQQLNPHNLQNYIQHYITTLFGSQQAYNREVVDLAHNIADTIENDDNLRHWDWFNWRTEYRVAEVQEAIHAHIVDYIEQQVRHIAWNYTHNNETIHQLVAHFSNEATRILTQSSHLNGKFVDFLYDKLQQKVWRMKERLDKEQKNSQSPRYPSDQCCVCLEGFEHVQKVFLEPCGHDICAGCAHQLYFGHGHRTCSLCRRKVNLAKLREVLRV